MIFSNSRGYRILKPAKIYFRIDSFSLYQNSGLPFEKHSPFSNKETFLIKSQEQVLILASMKINLICLFSLSICLAWFGLE